MNEMLLLGAGASKEAGIPTAFEMTRSISDQIRKDWPEYGRVISYVVGGLLFDGGQRNEDPLAGQINVEALFNAVQLLAERNSLEAAPFIGSWHPMVEQFDKRSSARLRPDELGRRIWEFRFQGHERRASKSSFFKSVGNRQRDQYGNQERHCRRSLLVWWTCFCWCCCRRFHQRSR